MAEEEWDEEWDEEEESEWEVDPAMTPHAVPAKRKPYPGATSKKRRKMQYADRLRTLLRAYNKVLILQIDNVGSPNADSSSLPSWQGYPSDGS